MADHPRTSSIHGRRRHSSSRLAAKATLRLGITRRRLLGASAATAMLPLARSWAAIGSPRDPAARGSFRIRGISYPSFRNGNYATADSAASLLALSQTGANYVAIIPTQFTKSLRHSDIFTTDKSESDTNVVQALRDARAARLSVMLKPHVDSTDGKPREYYAPSDVGAWFRNYESFLVHYARLAAEHGLEMFCIGCELDSLVAQRYRENWLKIIGAVRNVFTGQLTYAATWNGAKDVSFWDAVDYIGIDAYNPLSSSPNPSVDELAQGWLTVPADDWVASKTKGQPPLEFYRALSARYEKPMIFTEIGYRSVIGAAARPGDWRLAGNVDLETQAHAYEAMFRVWSREAAWMQGAFLWHWVTRPLTEHSEHTWRDYTPQSKPAVSVITRWYRG